MADLICAVEQINQKPYIHQTTRVLLRDGELLTKTSNLTRYPESKLAEDFRQSDDEFFVDCSVAVFDHVLDYIISGKKEITPTQDADLRAKVMTTIMRLGLMA